MNIEKQVGLELLQETIGIPIIKIVSNDIKGSSVEEGPVNTHQKIVFDIKEDDPEIYAIGVLFCLALMSFSYAAPRGYSEEHFIPDEEWNLGYFIKGLSFENKSLCFSADYVSGRLMKTDITFNSDGRVTLETRNRGKEADRWITHLKGKSHIKAVKK